MGRLKDKMISLQDMLRDVADDKASETWWQAEITLEEAREDAYEEILDTLIAILDEEGIDVSDFEEFSDYDVPTIVDDALSDNWQF